MADSSVHGNGEVQATAAPTGSESAVPPLMRNTLPIPDPQHVGLTTYDAKCLCRNQQRRNTLRDNGPLVNLTSNLWAGLGRAPRRGLTDG